MINDLWYRNAVIYCLSVANYMDVNGDGIGDFTGLMRRLDYLHGLGITAIWLMPYQVSPHRDDGYDVSDYYGVDPRYGTISDLSNSPMPQRPRYRPDQPARQLCAINLILLHPTALAGGGPLLLKMWAQLFMPGR
jgi:hypothetical protein